MTLAERNEARRAQGYASRLAPRPTRTGPGAESCRCDSGGAASLA